MIRGKLNDHQPYLIIEDCAFIVRPKGRAKVLRNKRGAVHAFIQGYPVQYAVSETELGARETVERLRDTLPVQIEYDVNAAGHFYETATKIAVERAEYVECRRNGTMWAWGLVRESTE